MNLQRIVCCVCALFLILHAGAADSLAGKPLKVFVLVGQSNMQGHADVRTLPHMAMTRDTSEMHRKIIDEENGQPRVYDDVQITYLSANKEIRGALTTGFGASETKLGPELAFGITMHEKLGEPILIIKTAWGGKSLHTDFRPPSAGPYRFSEDALKRFRDQGKDVEKILRDKKQATGYYYRLTLDHVRNVLSNIEKYHPAYKEVDGYELSGLVWFQGWNDMVDRGTYPNRGEEDGYGKYSEVLTHLIRDLRKDLKSPELPFVIGVMGAGGPTSKYTGGQRRYQKIHQNFRDAMSAPAAMNEFRGNVVAVKTEDCWDMQLSNLIARDNEIRNRVRKHKKNGTLQQLAESIEGQSFDDATPELQKKMNSEKYWQEVLRAREFSRLELTILMTGRSNAEFHYLGSSVILSRIGEAFAKALF